MGTEAASVKTVCPYCGVGCGMVLQVKDGQITKLTGDKDHPTNFGRLCTKGLTSAKAIATCGRMERASVRDARKDDQLPVSIDIAISKTAQRLRSIIGTHGPDALAFYVSGQMSLEAQYLANKLAKGFIRTNNIDSNSRLCMSSAASGYKLSLGADGPPGSYQDFDKADVFFVAGANMADCHPILFLRMMDRVKAGAKLIVVDPRRTITAEKADLFLQVKPGTDLALLNGLLHLLVANGRVDTAFIDEFTEGWEAMSSFLEAYTPHYVAEVTGVPETDIRTAAQWIGDAGEWMSCWTMGFNQNTQGTWQTNAVCNLHLATGAICRLGSGPFSLTGQPNAMGGREVGYLSYALPGQRSVESEADRRFVEDLWNLAPGTIGAEPGPDTVAMFNAMQTGDIRAVWIICTNPVATVPNRQNVIAGLKAAELVITQDAYLDTETNIYADIMLPGALWAEASGVMINSERNLTLMEKAVEPPGEALPDWQIIARVACAMGFEDAFSYASSAEVFDEIRAFWNPKTGYDIRGASHERLRSGALQWPCPPEDAQDRHPIRYLNTGVSQTMLRRDDGSTPNVVFPTKSGKARFFPRPAVPHPEQPDVEFPFVLNTGRLPHQWHTLTKTGKVATLNKLNPGPFVEINPEDAAVAGIADKDAVAIQSRRGKAILPASVTTRVLPGCCFVPFHWNDTFGDNLAINAVTGNAADPISLQPAFKFCAVSLARVGPAFKLEPGARDDQTTPVTSVLPMLAVEEGNGVMVATRPVLQPIAEAFAAAIDFKPVPPPALTTAESVYLSGFISGLKSLEALGEVPTLPNNAPFAPDTRLWLDGVLAGLSSRTGSAGPRANGHLPDHRAPALEKPNVTVLWASQTGNAEGLAQKIADTLSHKGAKVQLTAMADYSTALLAKETNLILVSSTYGDGDPPDNGKSFWEFLSSDAAPRLETLTYTVCALGDPSYDQFCNYGKSLDARLAGLGAKRLNDRLDCDTDYDDQASPWIETVAGLVTEVGKGEKKRPEMAPANIPAGAKYGKANPFQAKLIGNTRLNTAGAEKDTRFFKFSLAGSDLTYEAGDALGVWPANCPDMVDEILTSVGLDGDAPVSLSGKGDLPLKDALRGSFELTRPSREMLQFVADRSANEGLKPLLADDRKEDLKRYIWGRQVADVLADYPVKASPQEFVSALKRMQHRLYSISSSPKAHQGEVHLTVSAVRYGERKRKGTCSTFLADRAADIGVPIFIQPSSHFRLPKDQETPVIMIGPGTGVAPFRAFLHDRRAAGATGRNWLFFGEQHQATDFYYRDELTEMQQQGLLTELSLAFSRDQAEKVYVQDRLVQRGADVWAWLQDGAHVYVCGDASKMAKDVEAALVTIAEREGGLENDAACAYIQGLSRDKRYLRDVY